MAKVQEKSLTVEFGECLWLPGENLARPSGSLGTEAEMKATQASLASKGWLQDTNGHIMVDVLTNTWEINGKEVPLKSFIDDAMAERAKLWDFYQINARSTLDKDKKALQAFEALFVRNGKLIVPKYTPVAGYRRSSVFLASCIDRLSLTDDDSGGMVDGKPRNPNFGKPLPLITTIPVLIQDYSDYETRFKAVVTDNSFKTLGFVQPSPIDQLMCAKDMVGRGASQARLRDTFSSPGIGVKYYYIVVLNAKYPDLRIYERCCMREGKVPEGLSLEQAIPLAGVKYDRLQQFAQRFPENIDEYNKSLRKKNKSEVKVVTPEEVEEYFKDVRKGGNPDASKKMKEKDEVKRIADFNDNILTKRIAKDIHDNTDGGLKLGAAIAEGVNSLVVLEEQKDYPSAEAILKALVKLGKGDARNKAEKQIFKILGIE